MGTIELIKCDITKIGTEAIVNAANDRLEAGSGVCGAIFDAAGYHRLQKECNTFGGCKEGSAVITKGYDLCPYIIHAVGPRYSEHEDRDHILYSAYIASLELAKENGIKSIGFPLISAGIFGYPVDLAWKIAIKACRDFTDENIDIDLEIKFAIRDQKILDRGKLLMA
ncbi:MAG: macro domain-containing protein [Clostridia bacterium]|nr:macro domain-containing protein [Clostridia bacterium]